MLTTTNYGLQKPEDTDPANQAVFNSNMDKIDAELKKRIQGEDVTKFVTPSFSQASVRENVKSGETLATLFGKIMKWFSDLKAGAFSGVRNDLTATASGEVLDARQGKALSDKIDGIKQSFQAGCSKIAAAVSSNGVATSNNAGVDTIVGNIGNIRSGGNAGSYDIVAGKNAYSGKNLVNGSLPEKGAVTASQSWTRWDNSTYVRIFQGAYRTNSSPGYPEITIADNLYSSAEYSQYGNDRYNAGYNDGNGNGYNSGYANGLAALDADYFCVWAFESNASNWMGHGASCWNARSKASTTNNIIHWSIWWGRDPDGSYNARCCTITANVNCTIVSNKGSWNLNAGGSVSKKLCSGQNDEGDWQGYAIRR